MELLRECPEDEDANSYWTRLSSRLISKVSQDYSKGQGSGLKGVA